MVDNSKKILAKIDADIQALLSNPPMWGNDEALEIQFLTLLSLRSFIMSSDDSTEIKPGFDSLAKSTYENILQNYFGSTAQPACYLMNRVFKLTSEDKTKKLCDILNEVWVSLKTK